MALVLPSTFFIPIGIIIVAIASYWIIIRGIVFHKWQKQKLKDWPKENKSYFNFKRFREYHGELVPIYKFIVGLICCICCIIMLFALSQIYRNYQTEETTYQQYITEYNTLTEILNTTTDVVNSEVYLRINEYNKEITAFKAQYNIPNWSYNFTGNFNWNELNIINIKDES